MVCECGCETFIIESLKAFISNITVDKKGNIMHFKKENVELDDYRPEFCYCSECGAEIEYK